MLTWRKSRGPEEMPRGGLLEQVDSGGESRSRRTARRYIVFVAPDYPERVAKQMVDKHARAVESMAADGAPCRRARSALCGWRAR